MNVPPDLEAAIFSAVRKLPADQRRAYLEQACAGNAALRQRVEELIQASEAAGGFLQELATGAQEPTSAPVLPDALATIQVTSVLAETIGDQIGRYRLLQQIGEGGCGVVYMAQQQEPVRRRVALKVIKLGMDTRQVIARFDAERQALAMLDHPNIAKVLDGGATETGRPYFVMELVRGIKITDYCDQNNLSTSKRLDLFVQVCRAIQHAHQKGIIHRDIKPSNILVTLHDGVPVPKVIDFGIAKATGEQTLTDKTLFTAFEQFIGTPAYMSPEQAEMSGLDIDTRTDIYALGVLLYELLTGKTPFDAKELVASGLDEMRRTIREKEPVRPSTRLSTMVEGELTTTAKHRQADPPRLVNLVRGDLDWIVMKALEKDRTRRYETANGFAMDLQRYLTNEPVLARPPSRAYLFRKFVLRNKTAFAAASAVAAALVLGLAIALWQFIGARRAQASESRQRAQAQASLYDSLLGQARATRLARQAGYRDQVFPLLEKARALEVPQKNLAELRNEAVACLGDFVGLTPTTFADFPDGVSLGMVRLDATGRLAAFHLSDGSILLRRLPSGEVVGRLAADAGEPLCFNAGGDELITITQPKASTTAEEYAGARLHVWTRSTDARWGEGQNLAWPGACGCFRFADGLCVIAADLTSNLVQILDLKTKALKLRFEYPREMERRPECAVSPDGLLFAAETRDPSDPTISWVDIWDLRTGNRGPRLSGLGAAEVRGLEFSPDGKYLAVCDYTGVAIYSTNRFERVAERQDLFEDFSFAPRGTLMVLAYLQQNRVRVWDWTRNEDIVILEEPQHAYTVRFALDGSSLLTTGNRSARLYLLDGTAEKLNLPGRPAAVPGVAFSPDGLRIASVAKDRTVTVADAETGRKVWSSNLLPGQGQCVAYSPNGRLLVTGDFNTQLVWLWNAQTGQRMLEIGTNQPGMTWSALISKDGQYLATSSLGSGTNGGVKIYAVSLSSTEQSVGGLETQFIRSVPQGTLGLALAPERRQVAFGEWKDMQYGLYVWDWAGAEAPRLLAKDAMASFRSFGWDGAHLIFVDTNRAIVTVDVETGKRKASFPTAPPTFQQESLHFSLSPNGTKLALSSLSSLGVEIWDQRKGRLLYSLPDQNGTVYWLAWSPDSQRLAVSRSNGDISIWSLKDVEAVLARLNLSP